MARSIWQTPTGAMLWEIWARHKMVFFWQAVALLGCAIGLYWKSHTTSVVLSALVPMGSLISFAGAYLHLVVCFGYIEVDPQRVQVGYPPRLLLKPVSTGRLVL